MMKIKSLLSVPAAVPLAPINSFSRRPLDAGDYFLCISKLIILPKHPAWALTNEYGSRSSKQVFPGSKLSAKTGRRVVAALHFRQ